jgi:hypothetical protein
MTSPLLPYATAYLVITAQGVPAVVDGRITTQPGDRYAVHCYLKRQDSAGTSTGADYLPSQNAPGDNLPGVSGDVYLYRGYALRYAELPAEFTDGDAIPTSLTWTPLLSSSVPEWLTGGIQVQHRQGLEQYKTSMIERITGKYGGEGIDEIVSQSVGGIPITVRSGDLLN